MTLNVNGLTVPIKRYRVAVWIRNHDLHICCLQKTHLRIRDLYRLKVKCWKKYSKQMDRGKKSWGNKTHIRQNRLQNKGHKMRPRTLHNIQGKNPLGRHKLCKHICIQHRGTQIYKENHGDFKKDIGSNTLILGDFNTPLSKNG